ncbi:MAG: TrkH family potassium uptake protein [Candidatus Diapherotrites archaeon]
MLIRVGLDDIKVILRDTGSLLKWSAVIYLIPLIVSIWFRSPGFVDETIAFVSVSLISYLVGLALEKAFKTEANTGLKHAFMTTAIIWLVFTAFAAVPFVLIQEMSFVDSFFEAMSALTTTGLSMMASSINSAPQSIIFWRSLLSWIGGVGIVLLALIGVLSTYTRAAKLMTAEGRADQIKPNLKNSLKQIWAIYFLFTIIGAVLLVIVPNGLDPFTALNYSMSAISTTGMDTVQGGLQTLVGSGNLLWVEIVLVLLMLAGAVSFSVHYLFLRKRQMGAYFQDSEFRIFLLLAVISAFLVIPKFGLEFQQIADTIFHIVSALSCGGFAVVPFSEIMQWDDFVKLVLVGLMFIGGSAGSTAGGIKISRAWIFAKSVYWQMKRSILPKNSFFKREFEGHEVDDVMIKEISQFIILYGALILIGVLVLVFYGFPLGSSLFEVVSAQSNVGIGTGITGPAMPLAAKIMLILNMWIGRLEIIPIMAAVGFMLSLGKR